MPATTAQNAIAVVGVDIGKNTFHIVALDDRGAIVLRQKWSRSQIEARFAALSDWDGGLRRSSSSKSEAQSLWPRCQADACEVRAAIFQGSEERLPRCRSDRRSGATLQKGQNAKSGQSDGMSASTPISDQVTDVGHFSKVPLPEVAPQETYALGS
jgi:hypothetical protein